MRRDWLEHMATTTNGETGHGLLIRGFLLGRQPARSFQRGGPEGEKVNVRPKIGLDVNGEEIAVACRDDENMDSVLGGLVKGDSIELIVEARPPFGAKGAVTYTLPGVVKPRDEQWR